MRLNIKDIIKKFFQILSSKAFLFWMIGGWIIYYVISAIWMREAFAHFVNDIKNNILIQIPFVLFLLSGYLNLIRSSLDVFKKNKIQFFAWLLLPLGMLVFLTGFFISINTRQFSTQLVGEGDVVRLPWDTKRYRVLKIKPGLKNRFLDIDPVGFFEYEPKLILSDGSLSYFEIGAFPPTKIDNTYYHILNFGLAPGIRLFEGKSLREEGYMALKILVPGSSDYFDITPYPYRFSISMEPEKTIQKGDAMISVFNLEDPIYRVRVFKGEELIAEGVSREGIHFDDFTLNFFKPTFWVLLEAVKDPALPVTHAGIVLITIGIPLSIIRFLFKLFSKDSRSQEFEDSSNKV
jgi:hypothetical protein